MAHNYSYSYTIESISIEQGTFEVIYVPSSELLSPYPLHMLLLIRDYREIVDDEGNQIYNSQSEVPFSYYIEDTVKRSAPIIAWERQMLMIKNIQELASANGTVDFTLETQN